MITVEFVDVEKLSEINVVSIIVALVIYLWKKVLFICLFFLKKYIFLKSFKLKIKLQLHLLKLDMNQFELLDFQISFILL